MITAEQVRALEWEEVQPLISGARQRVYDALGNIYPATTRQIAEATGDSILMVRPRVTELLALGLVTCIGRMKREGLYMPVTLEDAERAHRERHQAPVVVEQELKLGWNT